MKDAIFALAYGALLFYLTFFMDRDLVVVTVLLLLGIALVLSIKAIRRLERRG